MSCLGNHFLSFSISIPEKCVYLEKILHNFISAINNSWLHTFIDWPISFALLFSFGKYDKIITLFLSYWKKMYLFCSILKIKWKHDVKNYLGETIPQLAVVLYILCGRSQSHLWTHRFDKFEKVNRLIYLLWTRQRVVI